MAALKYIQQQIDWEHAVHVHENTRQNEKHLDANRYHFTGQAAVVLTMLQKGAILTTPLAMLGYKISHLQRRIGDLGEFGGVDIDREYQLDENGKPKRTLVYFLPDRRQDFIDRKIILNRRRWWYSDKYTPVSVIKIIKEQA